MIIKSSNLFKDIPAKFKDELVEILTEGKGISVERIISMGHSSPPGFWYDQEKNEFVILLKGSAGMLFENRDGIITLNEGDYLDIPAHQKHRVEWTDPNHHTVWLAIFYENNT
jgi:cupin 2 domain-containing protein